MILPSLDYHSNNKHEQVIGYRVQLHKIVKQSPFHLYFPCIVPTISAAPYRFVDSMVRKELTLFSKRKTLTCLYVSRCRTQAVAVHREAFEGLQNVAFQTFHS